MSFILEFLGYMVLSFYILWALYLAIMNLKRARDAGTLSKKAYYIGIPMLLFGFVFDVLFNWIFGTIILFELPHETVFTSKLSRHYGKDTTRGKIANAICDHLLNDFDPDGTHCKEK